MKDVVPCSAGAMFGKGTYFGDDSGKIDQVQNQHRLCLKHRRLVQHPFYMSIVGARTVFAWESVTWLHEKCVAT